MRSPNLSEYYIKPLTDYQSGISVPHATAILWNNKLTEMQRGAVYVSPSDVGIVRRINEVKDLNEIDDPQLKDDLIFSEGFDVYCAYVEVDGLTEKYSSYYAEAISENEYFASLIKVYINTGQSNSRIPLKDEIITVVHYDQYDQMKIRFSGYPAEKPQYDPNLDRYIKKDKTSTKSFFGEGP